MLLCFAHGQNGRLHARIDTNARDNMMPMRCHCTLYMAWMQQLWAKLKNVQTLLLLLQTVRIVSVWQNPNRTVYTFVSSSFANLKQVTIISFRAICLLALRLLAFLIDETLKNVTNGLAKDFGIHKTRIRKPSSAFVWHENVCTTHSRTCWMVDCFMFTIMMYARKFAL